MPFSALWCGAHRHWSGCRLWRLSGRKTKLEEGTLHKDTFLAAVREVGAYLDTARPTAVNLHWAVTHMAEQAEQLLAQAADTITAADLVQGLLQEGQRLLEADIAACRAIGVYGADLLEQVPGLQAVLTHCNAGALATSMYGTALAPIYLLQERNHPIAVYSDETRPLLQGGRLTAWELSQSGIPVTSICDNMAGVVMAQKKVQAVIVGADRIAANGDTANKIGTYTVAVLAKEHHIPFYVARPCLPLTLPLKTAAGFPLSNGMKQRYAALTENKLSPMAQRCLIPLLT